MKQEFQELRKLLEKDWTQGAFARDIGGRYLHPTNPDAVSFCIEGALHRVVGTTGNKFGKIFIAMNEILVNQLRKEGHGTSIPFWNDVKERTKAEVLGFVDRVIETVD